MTNPKTALVTGGTFGIGRAAATALARQGLEVVITGRDQARASECFDHVIQPRASKIAQGTRL